MSISAEQKQTLAALHDQFKSPTGTHLLARNTHYFLMAVKKAGVELPDGDVLSAVNKATSGAQFASLVGDADFSSAVDALKVSTDAAFARFVAAAETTEQLVSFKSVVDKL